MEITRLKSQQPLSPYAASWDAAIGFAQWDQEDKIDTIRQFLLSKEEEILKLPYQGQGRTGLDENAVTTRYGRYHIFDFAKECPELNDLQDWIRGMWAEFIIADNTQPYEVQFTCWYNILRKGEKIDIHRHQAGDRGYLSANLHLDNYKNSKTVYEHMEMAMSLPNVKGGLTYFPGYVEHYVPVWEGDEPRVSLAMDLYIWMPPYYGVQDHLEHRKFIDSAYLQKIFSG
tara:strand:- start:563 stop:1249 length:687 start_codon:yes stop_codon:yes gene_type:complete